MKDKKKIDELFEQKMTDYEAEPAMDAWSDIQDRLNMDQRRKRMAYWRWATTAAAVILAFFGGYFYQLNEPQDPIQQLKNTGQPSQELLKDLPQPEEPTENSNAGNYAGFENTSSEDEGSEAKPTRTKDQNNGDSKSPSTGFAAQENQAASATESNQQSRGGNKPTEISTKSISQDAMALSEKEGNSSELHSADIPPMERKNQHEPANARQAKNGLLLQKDDKPVADNNSSEQDEKSKPQQLKLTKEEPVLLTNSELQEKNKKGKSSGVKMSMLASPTFAFRNVNFNESNSLTAENVSNEDVANSFTAGVGVSYRTNKKFEWEAGVFVNQWQQSNDRLRGSPESVGTTTNNTGRITSNTSSGLVSFNELDKQTEIASFDQQGDGTVVLVPDLNQNYQFVDIPLSMGYYLLESPHWAIKVRGGLTPRILTNSSANLSYPDGSEESVNSLELRNFSLQLLAGTGVEYRLNERFHLNLLPSLQYGLTPVNQHSEVDTYFHQLLIYSGLSYKF